jgi:hypothetical protein
MSFKADHLLKAAAAVRGGVLKIHARPQTAMSLSRAQSPHIEKSPERQGVSHVCHGNVLNRRALLVDHTRIQFFRPNRRQRLSDADLKVPALLWR